MTESEALKLLKKANRDNDMVGILPKSGIGKCLIKAMEEVQQYRAIGTIEELKTMKEHGGFTGIELAEISAALGSLGEYRTIGTVEECRAAMEKQKTKKVNLRHIRKYDGYDDGACPCCRMYMLVGDCDGTDVYCQNCGQKLDWSDGE